MQDGTCVEYPGMDIGTALAYQSRVGEFVCRHCRNWKGGCGCRKNVFIAFEEATTEGCWGYEEERRKKVIE